MPPTSDRLSRASSRSSGPPDRGSAGTPELFVYGTLTLDDVVRRLIDRVPASEDTSAPGWRVAPLPGLPYPGLVVDDAADALGRVYVDLTDDELSVLDAFENPDYEVTTIELGNGRCGLAYVWRRDSLPDVWTTQDLTGDELGQYLERCSAWRSRYEARWNGSP